MLITISNGQRFVVKIFRFSREEKYRYVFYKCIVVICVLVYLQYIYNISRTCECSQETVTEKYNFTSRCYKHYSQRIMSYAKSEAHRIPNENIGIKDERAFSKKATRVCQPQRYYAHIKVNKSKVTLDWVNTQIKNVTGGYHAPTFCRARYRIAILVPYRDRPTNLAIFLYHIHPFLQRQLAEYRIFVIEQTGRERKFNKGALFNIGFTESKKFGRWDCLIFHDVDLIPMDGRILYTCHSKPLHMASGIEDWNFVLPYNQLFGGVTMITPLHYLQANGYSNMYWNWGGEDDDFFIRLRAQRLKVNRLNSKIARYSVLSHKLQGINNFRHSILNKAKGRYKKEGLNSLQYRLIELRTEKLFTHIKADVNPFNYYTK